MKEIVRSSQKLTIVPVKEDRWKAVKMGPKLLLYAREGRSRKVASFFVKGKGVRQADGRGQRKRFGDAGA